MKPEVFRVIGIPTGRYLKLTVEKEGYSPFHQDDIEVLSSADNEIVCKLSKGGSIEGYVTDKDGNRVSGIPIVVNAVDGRRDVVTDANGRFIAEHLSDALYSIIAEPKAQSPYGVTVFKGGARCGARNIHIVLTEKRGSDTGIELVQKARLPLGDQNSALVSDASLKSEMLAQEKLINRPAPSLVIEKWHNGSFWQLDLKGKVVLLDFWGIWCGPCKQQIPFLKKLDEKYSKQGLVIIGVHTQHGKEDIFQFVTKESIGYLIAVDYQGKTAEMYKVWAYPTTVVIDQKGLIRAVNPVEENCEKLIVSLLKNK